MKCNQNVTMQYMPMKFVWLEATCVTNQTCDNVQTLGLNKALVKNWWVPMLTISNASFFFS